MCFSFSKLYVHSDEADPEQTASPDLPSLHFAVPSQVSRRLPAYQNLCCCWFITLHGYKLALVRTVVTSFLHLILLSSACMCRAGRALQSWHPNNTLPSQLTHVIRRILLLLHKLAAQLWYIEPVQYLAVPVLFSDCIYTTVHASVEQNPIVYTYKYGTKVSAQGNMMYVDMKL